MRQVLLVTYHFPPSAASGTFRMLGLVRHLPKYGWGTVVVAPPRTPGEPVDAELCRRVPGEAIVYPAAYPEGRGSWLLRRAAPRAIWLAAALGSCRRAVTEHRPDAVLTSGPPHWVHLLGLTLKRRHGLPWVADFRDPWISHGGGVGRRPLRRRWEAYWERRVIEQADVVVANAPLAREGLRAAFPSCRDKICAVTNGYDPEDFNEPRAEREAGQALHMVHAGEVYFGRDPRPLLDALRELGAEQGAGSPGWRVSFLGRACDENLDLEREVAGRGLRASVELGGQVSYGRSLQAMAGADVLLLLDSPGRRAGVPAKLYEYLGAGRPILALAEEDGDVAWVLRESGAPHRIAAPRDAAQIKAALVELSRGVDGGVPRPSGEKRSRAFTREEMARAFADVLNDRTANGKQMAAPVSKRAPGQLRSCGPGLEGPNAQRRRAVGLAAVLGACLLIGIGGVATWLLLRNDGSKAQAQVNTSTRRGPGPAQRNVSRAPAEPAVAAGLKGLESMHATLAGRESGGATSDEAPTKEGGQQGAQAGEAASSRRGAMAGLARHPIFLLPSVRAHFRELVGRRSPQWLVFRAQLDKWLPLVITGGYEGSGLKSISDYALGYQILKDSEPRAAARYADKAIAVLKSGLRDQQKGDWCARQFLARGDGTTKRFNLPHADVISGSLRAWLVPVVTRPVTHGKSHGQDELAYYQTFLKVSNAQDGRADYREGQDWRHSGDLPNNLIDWSLPGKEPRVGAKYYVTCAPSINAVLAPARLIEHSVVFAAAPRKDQAVFVEYLYGTHYEQTSAGDGGFNSIFIDYSYSARYLGKHIAMGVDWLDGYRGFSPALRNEAMDLLVRWSDYRSYDSYARNAPPSNFGAGGYVSRVMTALALARRHPAGPRLLAEVVAWRKQNVLPALQNETTSLKGGFWAEGWNYGKLAVENLLLAGLALEVQGLVKATAERQWANEVIIDLLSIHSSDSTPYDGGDWYAYPAPSPFESKAFLYLLHAAASNPAAQSYINYVANYHKGDPSADYRDMLFHDLSAPSSTWYTLPLQHFAQGTGLLTARSDWGKAPTWVAVQIGNLLRCEHQSYMPGQVQIRRGADDLLVNAGGVGLTQSIQRSTWGNTVVVDDRGEGTQNYRFSMGIWYGSPGVTIHAYEAAPEYVYLYGDYAAAYSLNTAPGRGGPTSELTRQAVYLRPDYVVVYDRVTTRKDYYTKQLRWHFLHRPEVQGSRFVARAGKSKLFGATFAAVPLTTAVAPVTIGYDNSVVQQLITQNAKTAKRMRYVTAFQVAPVAVSSMVETRRVASTDGRMEGVQIGDRLVLFGRDGEVDLGRALSYHFSGKAGVRHLLTNLRPGKKYRVKVGDADAISLTASSQGTIAFRSAASREENVVVSEPGS